MLTRQHRQEAMSRVFVEAVAARCGLSCLWRTTDYGIDLSLHGITVRNKRHREAGLQLDAQLKSATQASVGATHVAYDLEVKNYEDLRDPEVLVPRILIVVVMPADEAQWLAESEESLIVRYCGYWMSLAGEPPAATTRSKRVAIPRTNLLSAAALNLLFQRLKKGEAL